MSKTTGNKLAEARVARGLTVDEVAHATKLRPDKILALEHDDYSRFPNNAYVKGFLQIYGRFLEVDVSPVVRELENRSPVNVADYQYLSNVPKPAPERIANRRQGNKPSLAPLIVFFLFAVVVIFFGFLYLNAQRLGNLDQISMSGPSADQLEAPAVAADALVKTAAARGPEVQTTPAPEPAPAAAAGNELPSPVVIQTLPAPAAADVAPAGSADAAAVPSVTATPGINEVVLQPIRKTWVRVRRDDPNSAPIFEDFLYTNAPPLKLRGARFFIEVRDEGAVTIRKNGAPIAWQGAGVTIQ